MWQKSNQEMLKVTPAVAGVYFMYNRHHKIIYVGKSKNLKQRLRSYFMSPIQDDKTEKLVEQIAYFRFIVTRLESEALILENQLIKLHRPKYNILLKDAKGYPFIVITKERFARVSLLRNTAKLDPRRYKIYGPYIGGIKPLLESILSHFQLRNCRLNMEKISLACLRYQLHHCLAPCAFKEVEQEYQERVAALEMLLKGKKQQEFRDELERKMSQASEREDYEQALHYRQQILLLERLKEQTKHRENHESCMVYEVKNGRLYLLFLEGEPGKGVEKRFEFHQLSYLEEAETVSLSLLLQYYHWRPLPKRLILPDHFSNQKEAIEALFLKQGKLPTLLFDRLEKGKFALYQQAWSNLSYDISLYEKQRENKERVLENLAHILTLPVLPIRIECFDISNLQGTDAVASMSVAISGEMAPSHYRRFKIKTVEGPNDFAMLQEAVLRRYEQEENLPQLIVIDGGKGQLSQVSKIIRAMPHMSNVSLVSLAKREEEIFTPYHAHSIKLNRESLELQLLQKVRDEAHRFGVSYHTILREKRVLKSELFEIEGVGEKRQQLLLKKFKTIEAIQAASLEALMEVLPKTVAQKLYDFYHTAKNF